MLESHVFYRPLQVSEVENIGPAMPTLSRIALFAYDAVWTVALALNATAQALPQRCGNSTSLEHFDPLASDMVRRGCVATLFSESADKVSFEGMSVSELVSDQVDRALKY